MRNGASQLHAFLTWFRQAPSNCQVANPLSDRKPLSTCGRGPLWYWANTYFSSDSLSQSPATNFTGQAQDRDQEVNPEASDEPSGAQRLTARLFTEIGQDPEWGTHSQRAQADGSRTRRFDKAFRLRTR